MAEFVFISERGDTLKLNDNKSFKLVNIDGQTRGQSSLAISSIADIDGDTVNNVKAMPRTITFDLRIIENVELTKRNILSVIKLKQKGTLRWTQDNRELEIKGIVESIDMARWTDKSLMQITMHCEQPFWENIDYIIERIEEVSDLHYFTDDENDMLYFPEEGIPFGQYDVLRIKRVFNEGDVAVGIELEIVAMGTVTNPIITSQGGKFFGCGYGTGNKQIVMQSGDIIKINTRKNEKAVTLNGVSILSKIKPQSTWLQLEAGDNEFSINSDDSSLTNMTFNLIYKQRYL